MQSWLVRPAPFPPLRRSTTRSSCACDEHRVAEGQEAVLLSQRELVQLTPTRAREGLDHRQQRRAREMEVGEQHVDRAELETRSDEELRAATCFSGRGHGLEGAH